MARPHRKTVKGRPAAYRAPASVGPAAARKMIEKAWGWLDADQVAVLRGRYWDGMTVEQLAAASEITVEQVRRTESAALLRCRRVITGLFDPDTGEVRPTPTAP